MSAARRAGGKQACANGFLTGSATGAAGAGAGAVAGALQRRIAFLHLSCRSTVGRLARPGIRPVGSDPPPIRIFLLDGPLIFP